MTVDRKIGETAKAKLVGGEDFGCLKISDGIRRDVALKISGARSLYALLYEYFGDYWVPCGPDGPFPPEGSEIDITLSYPSGKRYVVREVASDSVDFKGDVLKVVARKPYLKPYDPKGKV